MRPDWVLMVFLLLFLAAVGALVRDIREMLRSIHDRLPSVLPTLPSAIPTASPPPAAPRSNRLVAVFPEAPPGTLDYSPEKRILREAGGPWDLVILEGSKANREGIANELKEGGARLLYFGGHGAEDRIFVSQGEDIGKTWLSRVIPLNGIEAIVLNACLSDGLASVCLNAGARVVICTAGQIEDKEAGHLAVAFLNALARSGTTASQAVGHAVASVDDATADMVRLRGDGSWLWERRNMGR